MAHRVESRVQQKFRQSDIKVSLEIANHFYNFSILLHNISMMDEKCVCVLQSKIDGYPEASL